MNRSSSPTWLHHLSLADHPFRLMLYLEWILLGIMFLGGIRPDRHHIDDTILPFSILVLTLFGLMGLKLPTRMSHKILYVAAEFGLLSMMFGLDGGRIIFFPLMGLIIVMRSCLIFEQIGRLTVTGLVFTTSLLVLFQRSPHPSRFRPDRLPPPTDFSSTIFNLKLNATITFGLTLLFTLLLVNALLSERQSRQKLSLANDQLRQYALRIENQATLQERNRIAREIHDALGHALTAQSIQLENALLFLPPEAEKTASFLQEARRLGTQALQEVRRSVSTLRSDPLKGKSLEGAIVQAIQEFQHSTGIQPDYAIDLVPVMPSDIGTALYRIVQESLTNIYKHSQATQVSIRLRATPSAIHVQIDDNGQGFNPERNTTGFGLQGMRERTTALGGQFQLISNPGQGCHITVSMPLPHVLV